MKMTISVPDELWELATQSNPVYNGKASKLIQHALHELTEHFDWCVCGEVIYTEDFPSNVGAERCEWSHVKTNKAECDVVFARPKVRSDLKILEIVDTNGE